MGLIRCVHHLQFACKNVWNVYETFSRGFGYKFHCYSKHGPNHNIVLKSGRSLLLLSEIGTTDVHDLSTPYALHLKRNYTGIDKPMNIAFEVTSVEQVCHRVRKISGPDSVLIDTVTHSDYHGKVSLAVVKSCVEGLLHTVIDSSKYNGLFLPGYILPELGASSNLKHRLEKISNNQRNSQNINYLDHVALACETHTSPSVMEWYTKVFGMKRTSANSQDDAETGFVVMYKDTGMQLRALDYDDSVPSNEFPCKFVFVEPLQDSAPNQVSRFLSANAGPGIQHIGLAVNDIFAAVSSIRSGGIEFVQPPDAYYDEISKNPQLQRFFLDFDKLRSSGVLVDTEVIAATQTTSQDLACLLQIFTNPLFEKFAFFAELIERRAGACGFGAGNITALWRAMESSMRHSTRADTS